MKEMIISIKGLQDVYNFISKAQAVDGDVTVKRGRYTIDGKSVLGVFSLDMSQDITVIIQTQCQIFSFASYVGNDTPCYARTKFRHRRMQDHPWQIYLRTDNLFSLYPRQ